MTPTTLPTIIEIIHDNGYRDELIHFLDSRNINWHESSLQNQSLIEEVKRLKNIIAEECVNTNRYGSLQDNEWEKFKTKNKL